MLGGEKSRINGRKGGRKKGIATIASENARAYVVTRIAAELQPIMDRILEEAKNGDTKSLEYLVNQLIGKPTETLKTQEDITLKLNV